MWPGTILPRHMGPVLLGTRFHSLPHVSCARRGDATVLMDRRRAKYVTLNSVGSLIWAGVDTGATYREIVISLMSKYDVSREILERDVGLMLQQLSNDRLIGAGQPPEQSEREREGGSTPSVVASNRSIRIPSVMRCGFAIASLKTSLSLRGFEGTLTWLRRRLQRVLPNELIDPSLVKEVERAVAMAGAFYPGRAKCLEQSLALYYLLRRQGVGVKYRHGVQFYPFTAHAWVEYRGAVINDIAEHVKHFVRFPDHLP